MSCVNMSSLPSSNCFMSFRAEPFEPRSKTDGLLAPCLPARGNGVPIESVVIRF